MRYIITESQYRLFVSEQTTGDNFVPIESVLKLESPIKVDFNKILNVSDFGLTEEIDLDLDSSGKVIIYGELPIFDSFWLIGNNIFKDNNKKIDKRFIDEFKNIVLDLKNKNFDELDSKYKFDAGSKILLGILKENGIENYNITTVRNLGFDKNGSNLMEMFILPKDNNSIIKEIDLVSEDVISKDEGKCYVEYKNGKSQFDVKYKILDKQLILSGQINPEKIDKYSDEEEDNTIDVKSEGGDPWKYRYNTEKNLWSARNPKTKKWIVVDPVKNPNQQKAFDAIQKRYMIN